MTPLVSAHEAWLVGHLLVPLVVLVYGSDPRLREAVADPWPWPRIWRPRLAIAPIPRPGRSS